MLKEEVRFSIRTLIIPLWKPQGKSLGLRHKNLWPVRHKSIWFILNPLNIFQKKTCISTLPCQKLKSQISEYNQNIKLKEKHPEDIKSRLLVRPLLRFSSKFKRKKKNPYSHNPSKNKPYQNINKEKKLFRKEKHQNFLKK